MFLLDILKNLTGAVGKGVSWIWDNVVPSTVKAKLANQLGQVTFTSAFLFVFKIFTYWYFYMTVAGVIVVYYLFKALKDAGILDAFQRIVENVMSSVFYIAHNCFPLIADLNEMLNCIATS